MKVGHLARRFLGSLSPVGPRPEEAAWAHEHLLEGELALWNRMRRADRRHSIAVAKRCVELLGGRAERPVVAAALLHDVGKLDSDLGTFHRVVATLAAAIAGRETAELWVKSSGITRRIGLYLKHPEIGADLLQMAGSDPLTVAWAREHHLPPESWTLDRRLAMALNESDDD